MAILSGTLITDYLAKCDDSITAKNKERISSLYKGKTFHDLYNLVNEIAIVDCGKNHEKSDRDPSAKKYEYYECKLRPKNVTCGHCLGSSLGKSPYAWDGEDRALSSRMILEDAILLMHAEGKDTKIPDELFDRINSAAEELMWVDVGAIDSYGRYFGTRQDNDSCIGKWYDFGEDDLKKIRMRINDASRPRGTPIMELKEIVKTSLVQTIPDLLKTESK